MEGLEQQLVSAVGEVANTVGEMAEDNERMKRLLLVIHEHLDPEELQRHLTTSELLIKSLIANEITGRVARKYGGEL